MRNRNSAFFSSIRENLTRKNLATPSLAQKGLGCTKRLSCSTVLLLSLAILFGACGNPEEDGFMHVKMMDNFFSPPLARVPKGGTVQFVNVGQNPHNAIAKDKSWSTEKTYGTLAMPPKSSTKVRYPEEGVFPYYCSFHATPDGSAGMVGHIVVGNASYTPGKSQKNYQPVAKWSGRTRRVPSEYPTIQNAVDAAEPGDLVLIAKGVYKEEVVVTTPSLILRGEDRNKVIIDGEFLRGNGIIVVGADGVAIENMTARNATLNGFFWTGVKGYRGSYLTALNNGDYGLYAFDSTDGLIEHSYASGSPDSSFYVGQCYPCKAILDNLIGENSALGYSGTNSGGDLYIIRSLFQKNLVGLAPNTLDSELLPPERETTIRGNIIINNNNPKAPFKALTWPTFGNGVMIAGGIRNTIEKNLISGHPNNGIVLLPNLQENFWLSYENTVRDNIIRNSRRADIAVVGPASFGNCFSGNSFQTSTPFGLQIINACQSPLRYFAGGDLSMLTGGLAMMLEAKLGIAVPPDYKSQPLPDAQPEMPESYKKRIEPAMQVFEKNKYRIQETGFHPDFQKYLKEIQKSPASFVGSMRPLSPLSPATLFFHVFGFLLPFVIYASWMSLAFYDMGQGGDRSAGKIALLVALPFVGALAYHLLWAKALPRHLRLAMLGGGAGFYLLFLAAVVVAVL